jgi:hypothetical protein
MLGSCKRDQGSSWTAAPAKEEEEEETELHLYPPDGTVLNMELPPVLSTQDGMTYTHTQS